MDAARRARVHQPPVGGVRVHGHGLRGREGGMRERVCRREGERGCEGGRVEGWVREGVWSWPEGREGGRDEGG